VNSPGVCKPRPESRKRIEKLTKKLKKAEKLTEKGSQKVEKVRKSSKIQTEPKGFG